VTELTDAVHLLWRPCSSPDHTASNGRMVGEWIINWKGCGRKAVKELRKIISRNLPGGTGKNHEKPQ
jgi:hypothetical protein